MNETRIYLVDLTAVIDDVGTKQTFRYSSAGYVTSPTSTPPNVYYEERLKQPSLIRLDMFSSGRTSGKSSIGVGELVLSNADGGLDFLQDYGFDGQELVLRVGSPDQDISNFTIVLTATMEQVEITQKTLVVKVKDKQAILDENIQQELYLGTGGLEGTDLSIKGSPKPLVYGKVFNIIPVIVNPINFIYQISSDDVFDIPFVYDRGIALLKGTNYTDLTELQTVAPAAGEYRQFQGYFRLGSRPVGVLTCDVVETNSATNHTVPKILEKIALRMGIGALEISSSDVLDLAVLNSSEVGIYIPQGNVATQAMDEIANSIGAYYGFDSQGIFRMGRLDSPPMTPDLFIEEDSILEIDKVASRDTDRGIPTYRVELKYAKNYTLQDRTALAAAVADERVAELKEAYRTVIAEDLDILLKHELSPEISRETLLIDPLDAQDEADRLLTLYSVRRDVFQLRVRLDDQLTELLEIGNIVNLVYYRYGLSLGKNLLIIGLEVDYQLNRADLTLWG